MEKLTGFPPGKWKPEFVRGVCTGVSAIIKEVPNGWYSRRIVDTILPDSDKEYKQEEKEIVAIAELVALAPTLHDHYWKLRGALKEIYAAVASGRPESDNDFFNMLDRIETLAKTALNETE